MQSRAITSTPVSTNSSTSFSGFSDLKIEIAKEDFSQKKEHPTSVKYYDEIANSLTEALYSAPAL
ncbi:hypothetical protein EfmAA818_30910 (plasmid) [Enterococcus faecium]|nr:hypothetical protein EfmAA818_30910 [Enterococcus faecium]